ncbi:MAG: AAA family ATPase [Candidatus Thorarchaeota archaeon]
MKLLRLELKNFKPFKDLTLPEDGELPDGLIIVKGGNSTGKSSLFEAVLWALWGSDAIKPLTNDELISFNSSFCKVTLTFEVAGVQYKIERSYDPANKMDVILFIKTETAWKRIADKSKSVARKLEEIFNLTLHQALNTLLVRQGEVALIAYATPSVLRDLLVKIYNIELLEKMSSHLEYLESDLELRKGVLDTDYEKPEFIQKRIDARNERIKEYTGDLKTRKKELKKVQDAFAGVPDPSALDAIRGFSSDVERRESDLKRAENDRDSYLKDAGLISADIKIITKRLADLKKSETDYKKEIDGHNKEQSAVDREIGAIAGAKKDLEAKIETLEASPDTTDCPTCSKPLSTEERDKILEEYHTTIKGGVTRTKKLAKDRNRMNGLIRTAEGKLREVSRAIDATKKIKGKQKDIGTIIKDVARLQKKLDTSIEKLGASDIDALLKKHGVTTLVKLEQNVRELTAEMGNLETQCSRIEKEIGIDKGQIKKLESDIVRMTGLKAEIDTLESLIQHTQYARRKLVSGFLADYVIQKRLIGIIRGATNQYVKAFTNGQYSGVDMLPTRARGRGGAGLVLKIQDQRDNATKKTSQLSFGDRTAISLGLRLGISRTMSVIRPLKNSPALTPRVRCVLLDEPLGGLDKDRRVSVVKTLINDQSFKQILLITHTDVQVWDGVPVVEVSKKGISSDAKLVVDSDD